MSTAPPDYLNTTVVDRDTAVSAEILANNGFFPDIALRDFMTRFDVDDSYSVEHRLQCLSESMRQINRESQDKMTEWNQGGYLTLFAVPQGFTGQCPERVQHYRDAVYCHTLMLLMERYRATDTTAAAESKAQRREQRADYWRSEYIRHTHALLESEGSELRAAVL